MKTEIVRKRMLKNRQIVYLRYFLIRINNTYGVRIVYKDEKYELLLNKPKKKVIEIIGILAKELTFPLELKYILEDNEL